MLWLLLIEIFFLLPFCCNKYLEKSVYTVFFWNLSIQAFLRKRLSTETPRMSRWLDKQREKRTSLSKGNSTYQGSTGGMASFGDSKISINGTPRTRKLVWDGPHARCWMWENHEVTGLPEEGTGVTVGKLGSIAIRVGVGQMGKSKLETMAYLLDMEFGIDGLGWH